MQSRVLSVSHVSQRQATSIFLSCINNSSSGILLYKLRTLENRQLSCTVSFSAIILSFNGITKSGWNEDWSPEVGEVGPFVWREFGSQTFILIPPSQFPSLDEVEDDPRELVSTADVEGDIFGAAELPVAAVMLTALPDLGPAKEDADGLRLLVMIGWLDEIRGGKSLGPME